ncbi:MAG: hypothetical protein M3384_19335, partial [Acidobacteriota bacterium]|nr:hypothetical protein [Acidobacteriota bacterium]
MKNLKPGSLFNNVKLNITLGILVVGFLVGLSITAQESQPAPPPNEAMPQIVPPNPPSFLRNFLPGSVTRSFQERSEEQQPALLSSNSQPDEQLSILLDGETGYVKVPHSPTLNFSSKFTIEAWVKPLETGRTLGIVEKYQNGVGGFSLAVAPEGVLQFSTVGREKNERNSFSGSSAVTVNSWHHIACIFNGNTLFIYLDGKLETQRELANPPALNTANLTIGLSNDEKGQKQFFNGLLDEVRISNIIRYTGDFKPESKLDGGGILGLTAGCWRFTNQSFNDSTGNNNHGAMVGNVSFIKELNNDNGTKTDRSGADESQPISPQTIINFDNVIRGTLLHNVYPGVSFYETNGNAMFAWDANCSYGGFLQPCNGQIGNAARANSPTQDVVFNFDQPVVISNFKVLAVDSFYGALITRGSMKQEGVYYPFSLVSEGRDDPVDVHISQYNCGQGLCNKVTQIVIHNITDPAGFVYEDLNYTPFNNPTPTPTPPCLTQSNDNSDALTCATPTPSSTPVPTPNAPTNLVATPDSGEIKLSWSWNPANQNIPPPTGYTVYRSNSPNGPWQLLINYVTLYQGLAYSDTKHDLRVGESKYYRVTATNQFGEGGPSSIVSGAPLSACVGAAYTPPAPPTPEGFPFSAYKWTGYYKLEHGFSVREVALNGRLMAKHMGIPSVILTSSLTPSDPAFKNLDLDNSESQGGFVSKLIEMKFLNDTQERAAKMWAKYCVSSPSGQESWKINIEYKFNQEEPDDTCEPSSGLPCARFYPYVSYEYERPQKFIVPQSSSIRTVIVNQRLHFKENNDATNVVALVQDCDKLHLNLFTNPPPYRCYPNEFPINDAGTVNPVDLEMRRVIVSTDYPPPDVISSSEPGGFADNIHQTGVEEITMPGVFNNPTQSAAGCPTCIHDHWRWTGHWLTKTTSGASNKPRTFSGKYLIGWNYIDQRIPPVGSPLTSMLVIGEIVKFKPEEFNAPNTDMLVNDERIWSNVRIDNTTSITDRGTDIVFWYHAASFRLPTLENGVYKSSELFHAHGGFFQPVRDRFKDLPVSTIGSNSTYKPINVNVENFFKHLRFGESVTLSGLPPLTAPTNVPANYSLISGSIFNISVPGQRLV